jgi:hypothetical protein
MTGRDATMISTRSCVVAGRVQMQEQVLGMPTSAAVMSIQVPD